MAPLYISIKGQIWPVSFRAKETYNIGVCSWVMIPRSFLKSTPISKIFQKSPPKTHLDMSHLSKAHFWALLMEVSDFQYFSLNKS
jgi:hypothetical protein